MSEFEGKDRRDGIERRAKPANMPPTPVRVAIAELEIDLHEDAIRKINAKLDILIEITSRHDSFINAQLEKSKIRQNRAEKVGGFIILGILGWLGSLIWRHAEEFLKWMKGP